jgi:nitroreductase / dihydropteridine reductase
MNILHKILGLFYSSHLRNSSLLGAYSKRHAAKRFDVNKKITPEEIDGLIESFRLTPTAHGLQALKLIHVKDPELKGKLQAAAYNQKQVIECSELFVLCRQEVIPDESITTYMHLISEARGHPVSECDGFAENIRGDLKRKTPEMLSSWLVAQTYLALGFMLAYAASENIDSCPMEGFKAEEVSTILNLKDKNLIPTLLLPVGHSSIDDFLKDKKKVRKSREQVLIEM